MLGAMSAHGVYAVLFGIFKDEPFSPKQHFPREFRPV